MPYIKKEDQDRIEREDAYIPLARNVGELNYLINMVAIEYLMNQPKIDYATLNNTFGAMELAAQEFRRRLIDPYEEKKINENGDIFPEELLDRVSVFSVNQLRKALAQLEPDKNNIPGYEPEYGP